MAATPLCAFLGAPQLDVLPQRYEMLVSGAERLISF
jgi:hypothetical protein